MSKIYLKQIKFESKDHTYLKDITSEVAEVISKSGVEQGLLLINSKHTTLGVVVQEIMEPNLVSDIVNHALKTIPEDKRSTRVTKDYPHPICDYKHRCQDNPYCNEIDEDYNAASHIRSLTFSHSAITLPIKDGKVELGKYQQIAIFEFDGRDGTGKNPIRNRTVQIWIYQFEQVSEI